MSSQTIRIAMLIAETPTPLVLSQRGSFGNIFHDLFRAAASRISPGVNVESTEYDVRQGEFPSDLSLFDGILVTGSPSSAYDDLEWVHELENYIRHSYTNYPGVKIFGACFGHQIICQSLLEIYGVRVELDPKGFENGVHEVTITEDFRKAFGSRQATTSSHSSTPQIPDKLRLQFIHGDHVRFPSPNTVPSSWINVGSTTHCAVQGVYQPGRVLTLQGHFEFDRFINAETLKNAARELDWTPEALAEYLRLVDADDDAELAAEIVLGFFLEKGADNA